MTKKTLYGFLFTLIAFVSLSGSAYASTSDAANLDAKSKNIKEWTVLVFMNSDNNLDEFGLKDINEMEKIGSTDQMNIIVLQDRENSVARRLYITKDSDETKITSKVIEELGNYDMGNYQNLIGFVAWGVNNYPAKKYVLDIWNHGSGWKKSKRSSRGISYDDQSGTHISTPELGKVMAAVHESIGKKLDILLMDACLMQMAEVNYEIKDYVRYCVASEETAPGDGYAYDLFLGPLSENTSMNGYDLAKIMVQSHAAYYSNAGETSTQSAIDLERLENFTNKFDSLCAKMTELTADKNFVKDINKKVLPFTQAFYYPENIDLGHFLKIVQRSVNNKEIQALITETLALYAAGQNPLVIENGVNGFYTKNTTGLAIYFPPAPLEANYRELKFAKTNWALFLDSYYRALGSNK